MAHFPHGADPPATDHRASPLPVQLMTYLSLREILAPGSRGRGVGAGRAGGPKQDTRIGTPPEQCALPAHTAQEVSLSWCPIWYPLLALPPRLPPRPRPPISPVRTNMSAIGRAGLLRVGSPSVPVPSPFPCSSPPLLPRALAAARPAARAPSPGPGRQYLP